MGTEVSVYFWTDESDVGKRAMGAVFAEMDRINALMSTYVDESRISLINREAADRWVVAGAERFDCTRRRGRTEADAVCEAPKMGPIARPATHPGRPGLYS